MDCSDCGRVMGVSEKERRVKKDGTLSKKPRSVFEIDHVDGITQMGDIRETLGDHLHEMINGRQEAGCYIGNNIHT